MVAAAYSVLIEIVVWLVLVPVVWMRSLVAGAGSSELRERLGHGRACNGRNEAGPGPVLIHAVSLGEMRAAAPLVDVLAAEARRVLLTTGTAAGLDAARRLAREQPAIERVAYLPWDRPAVHAWLGRIAPSAVVVMETEIWPNLFRACADLRVPLFIANGRIRPRDVARYRLLRPFFSGVLECATWIGVQSPAERDRFLAIGAPAARVEVAGNLKFDAALAAGPEPSVRARGVTERPLVVAGSTHGPEERWLLDCARLLEGEGRPIRLVLAPRDIARAGRIARLARSRELRTRLWSEPSADTWQVLVLDRYATLRACYADADVVVIGGTFAPVGGHNILEPAALARPIVVGPHTEEIAPLVQPFADAGALLQISGTDPARALTDACRALLADRALARTMGEKAAVVCRAGAGSAARHARIISGSLPRPGESGETPSSFDGGEEDGGQQHTGSGGRGRELGSAQPRLGEDGQIEGRQHHRHGEHDRGGHAGLKQRSRSA